MSDVADEPVDPVEDPAEATEGAQVLAFPARTLDLPDALGSVLREERRRQGRTLAEVAGDAAVSLPYLSEVERGRKDVSSELLGAITDALGVEVPDVLERTARRLRVGTQRRGGAQLLAA